ncbi:hypothetical protein Efla_007549 [Eimeria flavescens]
MFASYGARDEQQRAPDTPRKAVNVTSKSLYYDMQLVTVLSDVSPPFTVHRPTDTSIAQVAYFLSPHDTTAPPCAVSSTFDNNGQTRQIECSSNKKLLPHNHPQSPLTTYKLLRGDLLDATHQGCRLNELPHVSVEQVNAWREQEGAGVAGCSALQAIRSPCNQCEGCFEIRAISAFPKKEKNELHR